MTTVRYIVDDVAAAAQFYADQHGFRIDLQPAPGFAMLSRGDLRLLLNAPGASGAGQAATDGRMPKPGGWSRFQLDLDDFDVTVTAREVAGCTFRTGVIQGNGGRQALVEDPSGNVVELFEAPEHRLPPPTRLSKTFLPTAAEVNRRRLRRAARRRTDSSERPSFRSSSGYRNGILFRDGRRDPR